MRTCREIERAIKDEKEAFDMYDRLATRIPYPTRRRIISIRDDERKHREMLEEIHRTLCGY